MFQPFAWPAQTPPNDIGVSVRVVESASHLRAAEVEERSRSGSWKWRAGDESAC